ncbi:pyridoxal phosphate-dependent aminotransferase [Deinococcus radiophilus]|uniref:histidinol-phosphate transaminase n=1 Tax=Deinococcus radiophilus TaxID=32062 RepID=A0A3S0RJH9_9DEIO|nr:histidinol-phosphate transaminase [Deinococcus radiophilus]RTR29917.1 histidinol-phosphate aminotransferase family protein [Deinococcus radiophilus]UFA49729.1 histidinol-phosphate aminotransferase family protein [Deinococcus radiophilus]
MTKPSPLASVRQSVQNVAAYPYTPSQARIKLDQNESPYDFPADLKRLALERMAEQPWQRYTDLNTSSLRQGIARLEDWDTDGVVVSSGSNVMIKVLTELAGIGQTVLTTDPTFSVYPLESGLLGANLVKVPVNADLSLPLKALKAELQTRGPGLFVLIQPQAPTGHLDDPATVRELVEVAAGEGWLTVIDEAYHQFAGSDYRELVRECPGVLSLRTFSKAWGLAGLRLGYALAQPELAAQIRKLVPAFSINVLTQTALEVALEHPDYVIQRTQEAISERARMLAALTGHPHWKVWPSRTNFFLLQSGDVASTFRYLEERDVVVRLQKGLPVLGDCLRVSVGTPEENDAFLAAAAEAR